MAAVSIGKRMDGNSAMVHPDRNLVGGERLVFYPVRGIAKQDRNLLDDERSVDPDVLVRQAIATRPFPNLAEHLTVKSSNKLLAENLVGAEPSPAERGEGLGHPLLF